LAFLLILLIALRTKTLSTVRGTRLERNRRTLTTG